MELGSKKDNPIVILSSTKMPFDERWIESQYRRQ